MARSGTRLSTVLLLVALGLVALPSLAQGRDTSEGHHKATGWWEGLSPDEAHERSVKADTWVYDVANDTWRECTPKTSPPRGMPMNGSLFSWVR